MVVTNGLFFLCVCRRYEPSSGESSPELPSVGGKRSYYHKQPQPSTTSSGGGVGVGVSPACSSSRNKKPHEGGGGGGGGGGADSPPYYSGYNSSEEYEATRRPYLDPEVQYMYSM